ncbi:MAG: ABC transporter ATP-binding protein [Solirubrobacteraceae bacterium]
MESLIVKNINKYFYEPSKFHVLKDISFTAKRGEFLSLIGKSGSGKSTLLYVLSTMDTDYSGEIFIEDQLVSQKSIDSLAEIRNKKIGFIFQFHYLLSDFTALRNVMIPALKLGILSKKEIEERAYQKLVDLDMQDQALKPAKKLSGGQQQRVAIARALINEPSIIMADEPTGNLDSKNSENVFEIFQELSRKNNQTVIVVTHDNDFAKRSDRIIELLDGKII